MQDEPDAAATFISAQEAKVLAFIERYDVDVAVGWTDAQLDRALFDHDFPALAALPAEPRGQARVIFSLPDDYVPQTEDDRHHWRRLNASHLLAHVMVHDGVRCPGCQDW